MDELPRLPPDVLLSIQDHVRSNPGRPSGGLLLGRLERGVARVETAFPATGAEVHQGEIAFTDEVWSESYARLSELPGSSIVGWYHSHPGQGVALSDYDRALHSTAFSDSSMVALVVDASSREVAWYGWSLGRLFPMGQVERATPEEKEPAEPRRGILIPAAAAVLALLILAGLWLGTRVGGEAARAGASRLRQAEAVQARLRSDLARTRTQLASAKMEVERAEEEIQGLQARLQDLRAQLRRAERKAGGTPGVFVFRYRVRWGDTMWELADRFYGSPLAWPRITRPSGRIRNPNLIRTGEILRIPLRNM